MTPPGWRILVTPVLLIKLPNRRALLTSMSEEYILANGTADSQADVTKQTHLVPIDLTSSYSLAKQKDIY